MMTQETEKVRKQMQMVCIDDLVPRKHLLRLIDKAIEWKFIYDLVRDTYYDGMGRTEIFVDATHVKARANNRKMQKRIAKQEALFYADMLRQDINADREAHGKKPLKDKDDNNNPGSGGNDKFEDYTDDVPSEEKTIKCSTTDPESGWFRKGEHKHVFAYGIETACDKNGWIIDFTVNPGNEHDSRTFKGLYD